VARSISSSHNHCTEPRAF